VSTGARRGRASAAIELIQPAPDATGYEARFAQSHGPGACSFRFEVSGVEVARERLHSLGAPTVDVADIDGRRRFIRPAEFSLGTAFEFVEYAGD
jgi:4-hydroxyphenylpyruvate dioxygenase-like putative hemolysin